MDCLIFLSFFTCKLEYSSVFEMRLAIYWHLLDSDPHLILAYFVSIDTKISSLYQNVNTCSIKGPSLGISTCLTPKIPCISWSFLTRRIVWVNTMHSLLSLRRLLFQKILDVSIIWIIVESILNPFIYGGRCELSEKDIPMIEIGVFTTIRVL